MMPGTHHVKRATKMDPKVEPCFYLNSGNDHSSNCCKILLPSGVTSYSADVVWGYRRVPFVGEIATCGGGGHQGIGGAGKRDFGKSGEGRNGERDRRGADIGGGRFFT